MNEMTLPQAHEALKADFPALFDRDEFQEIAGKWDDWRATFRVVLFTGSKARTELAGCLAEMDKLDGDTNMMTFLDGLRGLAEFIDNAKDLIRQIECRAFLAAADASGIPITDLFDGEAEGEA